MYDDIVDSQLKNVYSDLETIALGEYGLKMVEEYLNEFFVKFTDEAMAEAERLEKVNDADGKAQEGGDYDELDDRNDLDYGALDDKENLRNIVNGIKEHVDNRQRNTEQEIRNKIGQEKTDYIKSVQKRLNEENRKNVQNIIRFIEDEKKYWEEKKNVEIDDDEDDD